MIRWDEMGAWSYARFRAFRTTYHVGFLIGADQQFLRPVSCSAFSRGVIDP
jgi:hypothetical protein